MAPVKHTQVFPSGTKLEICRGDITLEQTDAIVNAANKQLMHGGGVAAAIARRGGEAIEQESREWVRHHGPVSHSEPAYTSGGSLQCKYVIHAVGPMWGEGQEDVKLTQAIRGCLRLAETLNVRSIAFPAISTGIYGFPVNKAAGIFHDTFRVHFDARQTSLLQLVRLVLFDQPTLDVFLQAFQPAARQGD